MEITPTSAHAAPAPAGSRSKRVTKIFLIVLTGLWAVLLIPACMFAMLSPFAFDSGATPEAFQVFYFLIAFPFVVLFSPLLAWAFYWFKWYLPAILVGLMPALVFLTFILWMSL